MAFTISRRGSRSAVIKVIQAEKEMAPDGKKPADDQTQIEAAKAFAISEINALPEEFNGVQVTMEGHAHEGGRTANVNVIPQKLDL